MAMMTSYFDAAGDSSGKGSVCVGGFVSDVRAWTRFERRWREQLDDAGIDEFHMTDFVSGAKGFEKYKGRPDLQAEVLKRLCRIVKKNVRKSVAASVLLDDWRAANADYYLKECRLSPYAIGAFSVIDRAVRWIGRADKGHTFTEFIFEQGDSGQGDFKWLMDELLRTASREDRKILEPIYPVFKPKSLQPLQACDFVMWEMRKGTAQIDGVDMSPVRDSMLELLDLPRSWGTIRRARIVEWAEQFGVPKRGDPTWNRRTWRPRFLVPTKRASGQS